jgi:arsenite methyltransferase
MTDYSAPASPAPKLPDLSAHFERMVVDRHLKAGRLLAEAMQIGPGASVLELACGTGLLSEHLADLVGPAGDVLGLDGLPLRVQMAHQRSRHNLRFQFGHAQALQRFPNGCFHAICVVGVLRGLAEKVEPLRQLHRLLKPGGRLGVVEACSDHPHPVVSVQRLVMGTAPYTDFPPPPETQEWPLNADGLADALREAGFAAVELRSEPDVTLHASANAAIEFVQAGAWGRFLQHLSPALRELARSEICARLDRLQLREGIRHNGVRLMAVATR